MYDALILVFAIILFKAIRFLSVCKGGSTTPIIGLPLPFDNPGVCGNDGFVGVTGVVGFVAMPPPTLPPGLKGVAVPTPPPP